MQQKATEAGCVQNVKEQIPKIAALFGSVILAITNGDLTHTRGYSNLLSIMCRKYNCQKIHYGRSGMTAEQMEQLYFNVLRSGSTNEQYNLSIAFGRGEGGVQQDIEKSQALMFKAAERGFEPAINFITKILPSV
jgi:hypothetical protein